MSLKRHDSPGGQGYPSPFGPSIYVQEAAELLRPIRLHHWRLVLRYSGLQEEAERAGAKDVVKRMRKYHALHLGYVQQLNEFFEPGDTAEDEPA